MNLQETAKQVSIDNKCPIIYANSKNEFFTSKNLAELSDKKENIKTFDFTEEHQKAEAEAKAKADADAEKVAADANKEADDKAAKAAADAIAVQIELIGVAKTKEAAEALLVGYENNADVKAAVSARVLALTSQTKS